jgi:signal transduction histidine kinase
VRLLPRSLFGRLVLVLLAGLLVAQLATLYINAGERDQLLYRSGGMHAAQRVADLVNLLDSITPAERLRVAAVFDGPPLAVTLDRPPLPADPNGGGDLQLTMLATMLRYGVGEGMPVTIVRASTSPPASPLPERRRRHRIPAMGSMMGSMMGQQAVDGDPSPFPQNGNNFLIQVGLHDGSLVTFDSYLSPEAAAVPGRIALTLLALLVTVVTLSLIAVRWVTVPLRTLANAAEKLGEDINRAPLPETGPVEVRQAARAFNTMQRRLAQFIADRARIFAAMSHDLKTPITRLRLRTELLDDDQLRARFVKDLEEMEAMVTQTLEYLRDAAAQEPGQPIDVDALLESLQHDYQETGGDVQIRGQAAGPYVGRPLALRRCLTNLIDNALRYGKRATVVIEDAPAMLTLTVQDEGPGLPEGMLEQAFEPFFRMESSRSRATGGTGLGLGIARNIARGHGGDVVLRNREGGGLAARLTLSRPTDVGGGLPRRDGL